MVAHVIGVKKPPWSEMNQWWRLWHRSGHRWTEKCNRNVLTAIGERALSWASHARLDCKEICAKALRCQGLQWWRWRQLHRKEVEKDKLSGPHPKRFKMYRWEDMVSADRCLQVYRRRRWLCGTNPNVHGLAPTCSRLWALERVCKIWKEPGLGVANADAKQRYTRCLVDPSASGMPVEHYLLMAWTGADWGWWRGLAPNLRRLVVTAPKDND